MIKNKKICVGRGTHRLRQTRDIIPGRLLRHLRKDDIRHRQDENAGDGQIEIRSVIDGRHPPPP